MVFALWSFLENRMGASGGLMQIGKSKAKVYIEKTTGVTFADVEGIDEAEEELSEIVEFLQHPEKYQRLGGHLPRGVLLVGPPGTGKTLLARAVAGEARCRSSAFPVPTSSRCSSVSVRRACVIRRSALVGFGLIGSVGQLCRPDPQRVNCRQVIFFREICDSFLISSEIRHCDDSKIPSQTFPRNLKKGKAEKR